MFSSIFMQCQSVECDANLTVILSSQAFECRKTAGGRGFATDPLSAYGGAALRQGRRREGRGRQWASNVFDKFTPMLVVCT